MLKDVLNKVEFKKNGEESPWKDFGFGNIGPFESYRSALKLAADGYVLDSLKKIPEEFRELVTMDAAYKMVDEIVIDMYFCVTCYHPDECAGITVEQILEEERNDSNKA